MFEKTPRRVAIQQPLADPSQFVNLVYDVELEPLKSEQGIYILKELRPAETPYQRGLPFLHKGYFDSHLHVSGISWAQDTVSLGDVKNPAELVKKLTQCHPRSQPFISAFGWNESDWQLGAHDLNQIFKGRLPEHAPIYAKRICAHSALINEAFKKWIGQPNLPTFVTDKDLIVIEQKLSPPDKVKVKEWLVAAQDLLVGKGITAVGDMSLDHIHVEALKELAHEGRLKIDFQGVIDAGKVPELERLGPQSYRNSLDFGPLGRPAVLQLRHWKKYLDGSFGSRSAWLSQMYSDQETFGEQLENLDALVTASAAALKKGFYLSFHTIGDAALEQALKLGDKLRDIMSRHAEHSGERELTASTHRLEHVQLIRDDQREKLQRQNFWTLCLQPHHRVADASFIHARLGEARYREQAYRLGSLQTHGIGFTLGSDAPIDSYHPLDVLKAAVSDERRDENLTFEEALWHYTTGSRLRLGLEPGVMAADATVFLTPPI